MKTRNFLFFLVLGCLFSCQQNEQQESSEEAINFSMSIDNNNLESILTRSGVSNLYAGKKFFSIGDVISMSTSNYDFSPFAIGKDIRTWNDIKSTSKEVKFYAHYPELSNIPMQEACNLIGESNQGVKECFFGMGEAVKGVQNIALQFKRMTVPVIVLDENGAPYNGNAIIKLHLKNQGTLNLKDGTIQVDDKAPTEVITIKKVSGGFLTNLIPQTIKTGDVFAAITIGNKTQEIEAPSTYSMKSGRSLVLNFSEKLGKVVIIEDQVPLRR